MEYILVSDIIDSRKASANVLMTHFQVIVDELNTRFKKSLKSPLTITLGDEYQGIALDLESSISILMAAEEAIIRHGFEFKLRQVVYLGEIDTPINTKVAYGMLGDGFIQARHAVEELKKRSLNRHFVHSGDQKTDTMLNGLFQLLTTVIDSWKTSDFQLLSEFIEHVDYKIVASVMELDRSNVWRREKTLRISDYHMLKKLIHLSISK